MKVLIAENEKPVFRQTPSQKKKQVALNQKRPESIKQKGATRIGNFWGVYGKKSPQ